MFIKTNLAWSKLRKTSKLGSHAVLEVRITIIVLVVSQTQTQMNKQIDLQEMQCMVETQK